MLIGSETDNGNVAEALLPYLVDESTKIFCCDRIRMKCTRALRKSSRWKLNVVSSSSQKSQIKGNILGKGNAKG